MEKMHKPSKIVFLDFDGVVRVIPSVEDDSRLIIPPPEFSKSKLSMLAEWCNAVGAKVVVSSDLREVNTLEETDNKKEVLSWISPAMPEELLHEDWCTPVRGPRHKEIEIWLNSHPEVVEYLVIDDTAVHFEDASPAMKNRLILTSNRFGLLPKHESFFFHRLG